ncbi:hypothetical protein FRX31_035154 [Thalictrum thalictroides]|uniref:Uncharacterized protein n=1 Tax=Thalictrum thalictroides TaxID=46969 RepID=A0A7J6URV3_THATH|nr:hypothetical protein FRX31_035154 [Thalictrum thalictroides]
MSNKGAQASITLCLTVFKSNALKALNHTSSLMSDLSNLHYHHHSNGQNGLTLSRPKFKPNWA